ncbi:hypothetical protein B0H13DRAFT_2544019 [Mycena leptocephala]|nr:hypothetical protein B0H13DRAFT_2544019 [Mycena leptocephala]
MLDFDVHARKRSPLSQCHRCPVYRIFRPQGLSADASYRISPTDSATPPSTLTPSLRSGRYIDATRGHIVLERNRRACMIIEAQRGCTHLYSPKADACFSMPARAFGVALTPRPDAKPTLAISSSRAACSLQSSHSLPRALPPPPSYGAASHVVLPLARCPVFTTSRFRSRSLGISPSSFRSRAPARVPGSASAPCTLYLAVTPPPVGIRDDHDVWRGGSFWRKEERTPECEREVKRCAQPFQAPASSEGKCCLPTRQVERSVAGVAAPIRVARLARPLGGLLRATGRSACLILSEAGRRVDGGRSRGSWGYACAARWRRACRLGGGGEDGGVIGRKRERGCADGASRLALRCADADDARITWMIRRTSPRLSRSVNAPLASRYRSSALGARHSALQTGFPPRIGVGMPFTPLEIAIAVDSGCLARPPPHGSVPTSCPSYEHQASGLAGWCGLRPGAGRGVLAELGAVMVMGNGESKYEVGCE